MSLVDYQNQLKILLCAIGFPNLNLARQARGYAQEHSLYLFCFQQRAQFCCYLGKAAASYPWTPKLTPKIIARPSTRPQNKIPSFAPPKEHLVFLWPRIKQAQQVAYVGAMCAFYFVCGARDSFYLSFPQLLKASLIVWSLGLLIGSWGDHDLLNCAVCLFPQRNVPQKKWFCSSRSFISLHERTWIV